MRAAGFHERWAGFLDFEDSLSGFHLLQRAGYGFKDLDLEAISAQGTQEWLKTQLYDPAQRTADDYTVEDRFSGTNLRVGEARAALSSGTIGAWGLIDAYPQASMARGIWGSNQIREKLTEFWEQFFAIPDGDAMADSRAHLNSVLRQRGLRRFADLLRDVTLHPAVLTYVGAAVMPKRTPNEFQAEVLIKQHTLGPDGDGVELSLVARLMTGFRIDGMSGETYYDPTYHAMPNLFAAGFDPDSVQVRTVPDLINLFLEHLARRPETALHVCTKLAEFYLGETPTDDLLKRLVAVYEERDTEMAPVLETLLNSSQLRETLGRRSRTPAESLIAAVRVMSIGMDPSGSVGIRQLHTQVSSVAGPRSFGGVQMAAFTVGSMAAVAGANLSLAYGWWPDALEYPGWRAYLPPDLPSTYGSMVNSLAYRLTLSGAQSARSDALLAAVQRSIWSRPTAGDLPEVVPALIAGILSSPEHGRY